MPKQCQICKEARAEWAEAYCQTCWEEYASQMWWNTLPNIQPKSARQKIERWFVISDKAEVKQ